MDDYAIKRPVGGEGMSIKMNWIDGALIYAGTGTPIEVTTMSDVEPRFINGLPIAYRDALNLWSCHYCGTAHPADLHKCPNCGGERR